MTNFDDNDQAWTPTSYDVVVISESVSSGNNAWLKSQAVGILTLEGANNDEFELGSGADSGGGGDTQINITDNSHYITSVFPTGVRTVTTVTTNLGYMSGWANGVTKLAHYNSNSTFAKLLAVDNGGVLQGGINTAAERRAFWGARYFANLTADGITLFNRALDWVAYNTGDVTAPSAVTDLATGTVTGSSVQLSWTAPGDDGATGTATTYDVRYSTSTITAGNWATATQASGEPAPQVASSAESFTVTGLSVGITYFFAIKTSDEVPNESALSNVPSAATVTYAVAVTPDTTAVSRLPSNGTNYTVDFTVVNGGSGTDDFDLLTTQSPGTAITVVSITGTGVTQGANPDSARVANVAAADSAVVTVTYSVADVAAGTTDTLVFTARSVGSPATTDDGRLELTVIRPNMTTAKAVSPSGTQPPGTDLTYTVTITNDGSDDAASVVTVDSLAPEVQFKVGSVVNNLPTGISVTVEYSDDAGSTWTYTPASGGCGALTDYDACVTYIRRTLQNSLTSIPPNNTGDVQFVARIQ